MKDNVTRLEAVSLGHYVPRGDFKAVIHSVFSGAANLQRRKGSRLLTLVKADVADLPQGIRVDTPMDFSFERYLNAGEKVFCKEGILRDERGDLAINLYPSNRWKCKLPFIDMSIPSVTRAWKLVWELLEERQTRLGTEINLLKLLDPDYAGLSPTARKMGEHVHRLVEMAQECIFPSDAVVTGLIGLGSGLTPSGDDFLVGFLTGLHCTVGEIEKRQVFLSDLGKAITHLSKLTNDISRTYLFYAARGQVSRLLMDLTEAIASGEECNQLLQIAENAMSNGYSSGMDTVTGLLIGLTPWEE